MSPFPMMGMFTDCFTSAMRFQSALPGIALQARTRMNGGGFNADLLRHLDNLCGHDRIFIPAGAQFDRQRESSRRRARCGKSPRASGNSRKKAGAATLDDFLGRAAQVDVHRVIAEVFHHARGVCHHLGIGAEELRGYGMLIFLEIKVPRWLCQRCA